jgi:hypothetical protein
LSRSSAYTTAPSRAVCSGVGSPGSRGGVGPRIGRRWAGPSPDRAAPGAAAGPLPNVGCRRPPVAARRCGEQSGSKHGWPPSTWGVRCARAIERTSAKMECMSRASVGAILSPGPSLPQRLNVHRVALLHGPTPVVVCNRTPENASAERAEVLDTGSARVSGCPENSGHILATSSALRPSRAPVGAPCNLVFG